jgi:D-tyrosyl-tRNA(Tyr) deacylase
MRAVIQRVSRASVSVDGEQFGAISTGLVALIGICATDGNKDVDWLAEKIINLRIFPDDTGKMNRSLADIGGEMLIVSQFTLYGDCRKGRRPGYSNAASPDKAEPLYQRFIKQVDQQNIKTASGKFQAMMEVTIINDGPVTLLVDSDKSF